MFWCLVMRIRWKYLRFVVWSGENTEMAIPWKNLAVVVWCLMFGHDFVLAQFGAQAHQCVWAYEIRHAMVH